MNREAAATAASNLTAGTLLPEMQDLFSKQLAEAEDAHLRAHSNNLGVIRAHLRAIFRYLPYVEGPRILDWGCYHAFDSCVLRRIFGNSVELHGCDPCACPAAQFHRYADLTFRQLDHISRLPYPDAHFDTVIGSGVIEHVANHFESLRELHRVIREGGQLILTFAPNQSSATELVQDLLGGQGHPRRYTRSSFKSLLLSHGFLIEEIGYHEVGPTLTSPSVAWMRKIPGVGSAMSAVEHLNPILDRLWPINRLGQNLFVIGRRVGYVHGSHPRRSRQGLWNSGSPAFNALT